MPLLLVVEWKLYLPNPCCSTNDVFWHLLVLYSLRLVVSHHYRDRSNLGLLIEVDFCGGGGEGKNHTRPFARVGGGGGGVLGGEKKGRGGACWGEGNEPSRPLSQLAAWLGRLSSGEKKGRWETSLHNEKREQA